MQPRDGVTYCSPMQSMEQCEDLQSSLEMAWEKMHLI